MKISIESYMHLYCALIKVVNSCTCPVVQDLLREELYRRYRMMTILMDPELKEMRRKRSEHGFCSASDVGG